MLLTDAKYANLIDVATCEREGVTLYAPEGNDAKPAPAPAQVKQIPKSAFTWDAPRQEYRCPKGHAMPFEVSLKARRIVLSVVSRLWVQ